jgi:S-(hydroxymethyl)glutathione dehydrogenase/alcohol dehydrogenase
MHIVAVDPVAFKRDSAMEFGATETFPSIADALPFVHSVTNGQGADTAIVTVGRANGGIIGEAFSAIRKGGICAVVAVAGPERGLDISAQELVSYGKTLRGILFGNSNPTYDIPKLLDYYKAGRLRLDELITRRYDVRGVNKAYDDMRAGVNLRGVLVHEH